MLDRITPPKCHMNIYRLPVFNLRPVALICGAVLNVLSLPVYCALQTSAQAQAPALPEVTVTSKLRPVLNQIDRKVYNVASELQGVTGSAAEVLNTLPSVDVDSEGRVSLRGDSNVLILIDGKPSAQLSGPNAGDGILQFSGNDIDKVEVLTTAPAEYKAQGAGGIINIITKKNRKAGTSGSAVASLGNRQRAVLNTNGSYNSDQLSLSGGLGLREDERTREVRSSIAPATSTASQPSISEGHIDEHIRRLISSAKGALEFRFDETRSLSFDFNLRQRDGDRFFDQSNTSIAADGVVTSDSLRHSDGHEWSSSGEQSIRWLQKMHDAQDTLEFSFHRTTDVEHEGYAYKNIAALPVLFKSEDNLFLDHDLRNTELAIDYRVKLSDDGNLKVGLSLQNDEDSFSNSGNTVDASSGLQHNNTDLTKDFRYQQTVRAAYGSLQQPLGDKWSLAAGVRFEQTLASGFQTFLGATDRHDYQGIYPSLNIEHVVSEDSTLSFGYSRRLQRPDPENLDPTVDYQDIHNLRSGNPNLLPQETDGIEASFRTESKKHNYGVTAYIKFKQNSFTDVTRLISPDVALSTKENLPKSTDRGLEFSTDGPITPAASYRLNGNVFYTEIDATALGGSGLRSTTGINVKASLDYRPTLTDTVQISFSRVDKRLTPQGYIDPINVVNFGYKHQVQPNLALVTTLSDAFNGQRYRRILETDAFIQSYQRNQPGQVLFIGLNYVAGALKKAKSVGFEYEQ